MKRILGAGIFAGLAAATFLTAPVAAQTIIDNPQIKQLQDQNIDPNQALLEALRRAAKKGPLFSIAPSKINLDLYIGEKKTVGVRITNTGDELGKISGVNLIAPSSNLSVSSGCKGDLKPGTYCDVQISYDASSSTASELQNILVGTINERNRTSFSVPITVTVSPRPVEKTPQPSQNAETKQPKVSMGPSPTDIARAYFSHMGGFSTQRGFDEISQPDPNASSQVAGVPYKDIKVRTVTHDQRFDPSIPYTEASLPVNRDNIITADEVIKAILLTPISNVMCDKVVATVESNVYGASGDKPLIQAGSKVIGQCKTFVGERVGIAWNRILTTDGRSIVFRNKAAETNDAMGLGGALGRIYQSGYDTYVLPIFSTMVDTISNLVYANNGQNQSVVLDQNGNPVSSTSAKNQGLQAATKSIQDTTHQIIKNVQDVRKITVVPAGSRIDIEINEDIYFKDSRHIVSLDDLNYALKTPVQGTAQRAVPDHLSLVPVDPSYSGPSVVVAGRRYKVVGSNSASDKTGSAASATIDQLIPSKQSAGSSQQSQSQGPSYLQATPPEGSMMSTGQVSQSPAAVPTSTASN